MSRMPFTHRLRNLLLPTRGPDHVIGGSEDPYLYRWWLIPKNRWFNVYLHNFLRSDDDRALHDHPWATCSIILVGSYDEVCAVGDPMRGERVTRRRNQGAVIVRGSTAAHRVALLRDGQGRERDVWTIFITGPKVREWGFWCPFGWRPWKTFTAFDQDGHGGRIGRGCD